LYVNGELLTEYIDDDPLKNGGIFLETMGEPDAEVYYDDILVEEVVKRGESENEKFIKNAENIIYILERSSSQLKRMPGNSFRWWNGWGLYPLKTRKHPSGANQLLAMAEQGVVPI
jgi:hypothetical protein